MATSPCAPPSKFPSFGFVVLDATQKIEEEELPSYVAEDYYPVYIGEIIRSRYQAVTKLGFGTNSTAWLCRDLEKHQYLTLKIHICTKDLDPIRLHRNREREITINEHLRSNPIDHPGKEFVRRILNSFDIAGPHGNYKCILYEPLGMNFTNYLRLFLQNRFPTDLAQRSIQLLLIGLDYLHQCAIIHTDITPNNVLQRFNDDSVMSQIEEGEMKEPIARKVLSDRVIYCSRPMPLSSGLPVLCDLGEARIGHKHRGDIMPGIYRAPEVILGMEWDSKVDIWSIGIMAWDLLEGNHLFFARKNRILDDEQHLAEMVSLLGPPPLEFLERSENCSRYWDSQGNWKGSIPIPDQSFEIREWTLQGEDRALFIQFLRRVLRWMPEERPIAEDLAFDEFLVRPQSTVTSPEKMT